MKRFLIALSIAAFLLKFLTSCSVAVAQESVEKSVQIEGCVFLQPYMKNLFDNGYMVIATMEVGQIDVLIAAHWVNTRGDIMKGAKKENHVVVFGVVNRMYACPIMKGEHFEAAFLSEEF